MAAITITGTNVVPQSGYKSGKGVAGETITRGMPVYVNESNDRLYKCDANASIAAARAVGLALQDVGAGQPLEYARPGSRVAFGSGVLTTGVIYIVGATTAGDIAPSSDGASGWYKTILGVAEDTSILNLGGMFVSDVAQ